MNCRLDDNDFFSQIFGGHGHTRHWCGSRIVGGAATTGRGGAESHHCDSCDFGGAPPSSRGGSGETTLSQQIEIIESVKRQRIEGLTPGLSDTNRRAGLVQVLAGSLIQIQHRDLPSDRGLTATESGMKIQTDPKSISEGTARFWHPGEP